MTQSFKSLRVRMMLVVFSKYLIRIERVIILISSMIRNECNYIEGEEIFSNIFKQRQ